MSRTVWLPGGAHEDTASRSVWTSDGAHQEGAAGPIDGDLAATLGSITLAATGSLPISGSLAATLGAVGVITVDIEGALAATLDAITLSSTAALPIAGALVSGVLDPLGFAGGALSPPGMLAELDAITLSATGVLSIEGALAKTLGTIGLTADSTSPIAGSLGATLGPITLAATQSTAMFFFAWTTEGAEFGSAMLRQDEQIFALEVEHAEGDFPALRLDVVNPRVGLLAAGRNLWCWLSWRNGALIEPLFHGRLIGIPEDLHDEVVRLLFVARPSNYVAIKSATAADLKVRPFWDPAFIDEGVDDPDTALEAYAASWHIDRKTLQVSVSDLCIGEDGMLVITGADHLYDDMGVSYGDTPLRRVKITATVTWQQEGEGTVDLTKALHDEFQEAGNPYLYPLISSFTHEGLVSSWPEAGTNIGEGWEVAEGVSISEAIWALSWLKSVVYMQPVYASRTVVDVPGKYVWAGGMYWQPEKSHSVEYVESWEQWAVVFPLVPHEINFPVHWTASRPRTETLMMTLEADVQPLLVDPSDDEETILELSSSFVAEPVDPGGAMPIGTKLRNSYFNTDRGAQSVEYPLMLARAKLRASARAVNIKIVTPWDRATSLSCRHNIQLLDDRLPGGEAAGKVTRYILSADGDAGELKAEITIGCTVGTDNVVSPDAGENTYIDDYIDGYYATTGATLDPGSGDITYQSFDDLDVLDDDGIDLLRMTPERVVNSIAITGGPNDVLTALNVFKQYGAFVPVGAYSYMLGQDDPSTVVEKNPTVITLDLVPIGGQAFQTDYAPTVSKLMLPKTIDLESV